MDMDAGLRAAQRVEWKDPIVWLAWAVTGIGIAIVIPGILTFLRERQ